MKRADALRGVWIAIACLLAIGAAGIYLRARSLALTRPAFAGTPVTPPKFAADAVLVDENGHAAHVYDPGAAATFLFFGYTHCPDECPLALAALGRAYRLLTPEQARRVRIVFVTVDPARDVPGVIKRYDAEFGAPIDGLTGTRAQLAPVWSAYGVTIDARTKELEHGDAIYAIDATQHVVLIYPPDTKASDLATDAKLLLR
jgi:protein SCO1/2